LVSLASAAMAGCAGPEFIAEHPVENQVPPLKTGVYSVKTVDVRPVATREVEPDYPFDLSSILTGKAIVVYTVRADGKVADVSVVEADDILFGEAAEAAIRKWRYHPAKLMGEPVDCRLSQTFVFVSPYANVLEDDSMPDPPNGTPPDGSHQVKVVPH
jgi:periplasmic protein TonB